MPTKLSELKPGSVVITDGNFTCLKPGRHIVMEDYDGDLFIRCDDGKHFLFGQVDDNDGDLLVGVELERRVR